jgi:catalase (peroxidase I)
MDAKTDDKSAGQCPVMHTSKTNRDWWPHQLDLQILHRNSALPNPMDANFDYAKEFKSLDLKVAGRLWPLRRADDPHGMACRGYVSHR